MGKKLKLLIVLFFCAFVGIVMAEVRIANQVKVTKKNAKEIFSKHCARCHGEDGKAETQEGLDLGATDLTSERVKKMSRAKIISTIKEGKGAMPSFGKELSKDEIVLLANYVRKLSKSLNVEGNLRN
jgi:cbb3-type cytochrome c oxidase subunit III